jgi:hypothetical protein
MIVTDSSKNSRLLSCSTEVVLLRAPARALTLAPALALALP